jgi:diguanylate cyclase
MATYMQAGAGCDISSSYRGYSSYREQPRSPSLAQTPPYSATTTNFLLYQAEQRIRELEQKLSDMSRLAHEDQLTGVLNRRGFEAVITREMMRAKRQNTPLCLAMLDIDNFKQVNDDHGHAMGDLALAHFARVLASALRRTDSLARLGGEEFVIALPDTPLQPAADTIARIQRSLAATPLHAGSHTLHLTFSAGITLFGAHEDSGSLLRDADTGVYLAKKQGKNRISVV